MMAKWYCLGIKCDSDCECLERCPIEVNPTLTRCADLKSVTFQTKKSWRRIHLVRGHRAVRLRVVA